MRVLVGMSVTVVVLIVGALVALSFVDWSRYVGIAVTEVKKATGRDLKIAGRIDLGLLPPRLVVEQVSLSNAQWGTRAQMVTAKRVDIRAALLPLLVGKVRLKIDIDAPDILLETDSKGTGNWVMAPARQSRKGAPPASDAGAWPVGLDAARITKAIVHYREGRTGESHRFELAEAVITPASSAGDRISVKGEIDGVPVSLDATTDGLLIDTLGAGGTLGIDLKATMRGASLAAAGRVGFPAAGPQLALKLRAAVDDNAPLRKALGLRLPRLEFEGEVDAAKRVYTAKNVKLAVGKSQASGTFRADLSGSQPKIHADVESPLIDLLEVQALQQPASASPAESKNASKRVFSSDPLPLTALHAADIDAKFSIGRMVLPPEILLEAVHGRITLAGGRLETRALDMRVGGGDVKFAGGLDATGTQHAQISATVSGADIEIGKMMAALGQDDVITGGPTEFKADLRSTGASPAALAAALDGHVRIVMGPARTQNRFFDRAGTDVIVRVLDAVNPLRKKEPYTQVQCAVINVPVRNGVITVDRTAAAETSHVGVAMAGTVNLADETLDLSIRPEAKEGIGVSVGGLANLVKVSGPLADPKVGVDIAGAATTAAEIGVGVVTGGLSILARGLFDKATMKAPCETALRGGRAPEGAAQQKSPGDKKPEAEGIGGALERIFK